MGKHGYLGARTPRRRFWSRRGGTGIALASLLAILIVFHRPILTVVARQVVRHYAAKENLQVDFWMEGTVLTNLSVRNLHVVPAGPTDVESIDADVVRIDYSLFGLLRHGLAGFLKNVEVRSARIALNPAKTPPKPATKKPSKKNSLPTTLFPDRLKLSDISIVVRDKPHDFFLQDVDLDLDQRLPGKLHIGRMQLTNGQSWSDISGATSYANKNLVIRDVRLNDQDRIDLLNVDASNLGSNKLELKIESKIGGGSMFGSMQWAKQRSMVSRKVKLHAENISAEALNKYVNTPENFFGGKIEKIDVDLGGVLKSPSSLNGTIDASLRDFHIGAIGFNSWTFNAWVKDGQTALESADLVQNENHIYLRGSARLPDRIEDLAPSTTATLEIAAAAVDLGKLTAGMPEPVTGSAQLNGKIDIAKGKLQANFLASAGSVGLKDGKIDKALANISVGKTLEAQIFEKPWFADLDTTASIEASDIRYRDYVFDSLQGSLKSVGDILTVESLKLSRQQNVLIVHGRYRLPDDPRNFAAMPANVEVALHAGEVGDFWATDAKETIAGQLEASGQIEWKDKSVSGALSASSSNLEMQDLVYRQLSVQCTVANNVVYLNDFTARLKETGFIDANGVVDLRPPFHYSGKLAANVPNLVTLEPLLRASGNKNELAGSLTIDWQGGGDPRTFKNFGKLKLVLEGGRYGSLQSLRANIDATYSREGLSVPVFYVASDKMNFETIVESKEETLEITKVALNQGEAKYASGYISIPFIWKNIWKDAPIMPSDGKVIASFQSENIDIEKLFKDVGATPLASGAFNIKLDAGGTIADLNARLDVQGRNLRSARLPNLQPATFDLSAQVEHDQLRIAGKLTQSRIQPLELSGQMPFDIPRIVRERHVPGDTPITGKLHFSRSSVNVFRQLIPEVEVLDGDLGLDVDVSGKFGRPILNGTADMTVNLARFSNTTVPALRDFKARLVFADDKLTLERFGGELAGGRFTMDGTVTFPTMTSANLDLHVKADSVLVARNDTMTGRTDADIKIVGPLTSANVTGNLAITNSRFLKNIDLVPIGLPGRPAPQPPASQPDFSIPEPPFRDWKFDVAIKTKDPVLLRGNLATGNATCDLQLTGTGLQPGLSGVVRLKNVDATLPFSRLSIASGFLYFDPSDSLNPKIDLSGTSVIQDYTVRVYVYGTLLSPQAVFTSEPPLPQEEIISLLATGTTREQLTGDNNVLAGRAAMLLVQQAYRKIFKKGEQTENNDVFDRLDLDVGQVDPRTGQRQATARYRINKQFMVVGDVEVGGDFRVKLRYLIRFR